MNAGAPIQVLIDAVVEAIKEGSRGVKMKATTPSGASMVLEVTLAELITRDGEVLYSKESDDGAE